MHPALSMIFFVVLCFALTGHYLSQKMLLAKGWRSDDPQPQIRRLFINGAVLFVVGVAALSVAEKPYGLIGILVFIEAAVCVAFGRKLSRRSKIGPRP